MRAPTRLPDIIDLRDRPFATDLRQTRVAVIGAIEDMTYNVVASLGYAGLHVEVLTPEPDSRLPSSRFCRRAHLVPAPEHGRFPDDTVVIVRNILDRARIDLVVAADYDTLVWLADHEAQLAPTMAFPTPTRAQIEHCNDKWQLMGLCASLGIDHPRTVLVEHATDVARVADWRRVVVKPRSEGFGYGVYVLESGADVADHLARADRPGNVLPLLVQEHVPGVDIDVTALVDHGRVVSGIVQQRLPDGRSLRFSSAPELITPVERIAAAVDFHGVMDFDFRSDPATGRLVVIECNPRFPGSLINKTWAGCNLALEGVALALGHPVAPRAVERATTYHPPSARHVLSMARPSFWREQLAPTRVGWASRLRDPRYAAGAAASRLRALRRA